MCFGQYLESTLKFATLTRKPQVWALQAPRFFSSFSQSLHSFVSSHWVPFRPSRFSVLMGPPACPGSVRRRRQWMDGFSHLPGPSFNARPRCSVTSDPSIGMGFPRLAFPLQLVIDIYRCNCLMFLSFSKKWVLWIQWLFGLPQYIQHLPSLVHLWQMIEHF